MTINTKDIEALVDEHCSSIHPMELDRLLKKLDHEDLHVLKDMLEEAYEQRKAINNAYLESVQDEYYDKGYSDGYSDGFSYEHFRELLEFASKAVGYTRLPIEGWSLDSAKGMRLVGSDREFVRYWNPLQDDGDNARLEAVLGVDVRWDEHSVRCSKIMPLTMDDAVFRGFYEDHHGDKQAARRMASLRVAAEIGKAMK